jgi:hypothetical protein
MKFEYEPREEDIALCVAYIDPKGHLRIRDTGARVTESVALSSCVRRATSRTATFGSQRQRSVGSTRATG